jgi:O-antigen ligase
MNTIKNNFKDIHIYFLPLAAFFLLISTAATNILIVLIILSVIFQLYKRKDYKIFFEKKIEIYSIAIFFLLLISALYSIAELNDIIYTIKKYSKFLLIPIFHYNLKVNNNEKLVMKYFINGCTIILALSYVKYFNIFDFNIFYNIFNYVTFSPIETSITSGKSTIFQNYINHGIILSVYFLFTILLGFNNNSKIYYFLSIISFINIIFLTDSRSAYIIVMLILFLFSLKIKNTNFFAFLSVFILLPLFFSAFNDNFVKRVEVASNDVAKIIKDNDIDSSVGYRYLWANVGFDVIKKNPFFGNGVGSYKESVKEFYKVDNTFKYFPELVTNNPHNEFVSIASQLGIFGFILFLLFLKSLYTTDKKSLFSNIVFLTVFLSCLSNSVFYDNILGIFIIILICLSSQEKFIKLLEVK